MNTTLEKHCLFASMGQNKNIFVNKNCHQYFLLSVHSSLSIISSFYLTHPGCVCVCRSTVCVYQLVMSLVSSGSPWRQWWCCLPPVCPHSDQSLILADGGLPGSALGLGGQGTKSLGWPGGPHSETTLRNICWDGKSEVDWKDIQTNTHNSGGC